MDHVHHYQIHQWFVLRCLLCHCLAFCPFTHAHKAHTCTHTHTQSACTHVHTCTHTSAHTHFFPNCLRIGWRHSVFMSEQAYSLTNHSCILSKIRRLSIDSVLTRIHKTYSDFISYPNHVLSSHRLP